MQLPDSPQAYFTAAYRDELQTPEMKDYAIRLQLVRVLQRINPGDVLSLNGTAIRESFSWVKKHAPARSTILDIGCGAGNYLYALRGAGFHGVGIDPSADVVSKLKAESLEAYYGTIDNIPSECPIPFAITCNFVLHHLLDPVAEITSLKAKFPKAYLLIVESNVSYVEKYVKKRQANLLPPRALTFWGDKSMRLLFSKAGYDAEIALFPRQAQEFGVPNIFRPISSYLALERWLPADRLWVFWLKSKRRLFWTATAAERLTKRPPATLLAIGHPTV